MTFITVQSLINAPISKVWEYWTGEKHIVHWNFASPDWHCPKAHNSLKEGEEFHYTMAAKDGSFSFDFWGTYQKIDFEKTIEIILGDNRKMLVHFIEQMDGTLVSEQFEPESQNPPEMQQMGWQMILDNFKGYVENELG